MAPGTVAKPPLHVNLSFLNCKVLSLTLALAFTLSLLKESQVITQRGPINCTMAVNNKNKAI